MIVCYEHEVQAQLTVAEACRQPSGLIVTAAMGISP